MRNLLLLTVVLIIYGSLYPWEFKPGPLRPGVFDGLNTVGLNRFSLRDLLINVVLYGPVGFVGYLSFKRASTAIRFAGLLVLGAALSTAVEIAQMFTPRRQASWVDVIANTAGTAAGVVLALAGHRMAQLPSMRMRIADQGALALLVCGAAYLLYPFFPIFGRTALRHKIDVLTHSEWFEPVMFVSTAIAWFVAGRLLSAVKVPSVRVWLAVAAAIALPAQLLVLTRQPMLPHVMGAAAGVLLFCALYKYRSVRFDACAIWLLLVWRGLMPFRLTASTNAFTWSPFGGALSFTDWQRATLIMIEKTFFYGAAVWAIDRAGAGLWKATAITTGTLCLIEMAQIYLPGRTPEITDIVLPVLIGVGSYWAGRHAAGAKV